MAFFFAGTLPESSRLALKRMLDARRCEYCGRFDDLEAAHHCVGCGVFVPVSRFIEVTTITEFEPRYIRVLA